MGHSVPKSITSNSKILKVNHHRQPNPGWMDISPIYMRDTWIRTFQCSETISAGYCCCYTDGLPSISSFLFYRKQTGYRGRIDYRNQYEEEINEMEDSDGLTMVTAAGTLYLKAWHLWHKNCEASVPLWKMKFCRIMPKRNMDYRCKTRWSTLLYMLARFVKLKISKIIQCHVNV